MRTHPSPLALLGVIILAVGACAPAATPVPAPAPAAPAAPAPAAPAPRPEEPPFYAGKTLRVIVGFAAGGGYDTYSRLIARYIPKYIPGSPTVIVENLTGAGSLIAANHLYKVAKPDGLTIGTFDPGLTMAQLLGGEGIEFDARKFAYVGTPTVGTHACIVRADRGFKTIQDVIASSKPLVLGGTAPGGDTDDWPKVMQAATGANIKLVSGYSGTATIRQAIEAGEVDGGCWGWESIKPTAASLLESGTVFPLVQQAPRKHPDLQQVPMMIDFAKTEEGRKLITARMIPNSMPRFLVAPPATPPERLATLREALAKTLKDAELLADAEKAKLEVTPLGGEEILKLIEEMFKTPPDVVKKLAEVLQ